VRAEISRYDSGYNDDFIDGEDECQASKRY